jgi:hypothetical protein
MNIGRETALHTDQASWYRGLGAEYADHQTVNHQADEYVRGNVTTNTVEGYYSIFKRGMKGVYPMPVVYGGPITQSQWSSPPS